MPEIYIKKPQSEVYAISALLALGGLGLVFLALKGRGLFGPEAPLKPGEIIDGLTSPLLEGSGTLQVMIGNSIAATAPSALYQGPGRDTYTYFRIMQMQRGSWVTVYGSGVAGVHVGPAATPTRYSLVSPQEIQPAGCPVQSLCAFPWPGYPIVTNICGAPPQPGYATAVLEIYQNALDSGDPADADGFSSPTCTDRIVILHGRKVYSDKIMLY